jgi:mycothiol system anti-sigma-R factor
MICNDVRRAIYFFLDGELGENTRNDLSKHLNLCLECGRRAVVQRRLRQFVRSRIEHYRAPDHLKRRVSRALRAFSSEWFAL